MFHFLFHIIPHLAIKAQKLNIPILFLYQKILSYRLLQAKEMLGTNWNCTYRFCQPKFLEVNNLRKTIKKGFRNMYLLIGWDLSVEKIFHLS